MHREILPIISGQVIDHINGDGLDNRRKNLKICTVRENAGNHYRHRENTISLGAYMRKDKHRICYWSQIKIKGKTHYLGSYLSQELAHKAYLEARAKL